MLTQIQASDTASCPKAGTSYEIIKVEKHSSGDTLIRSWKHFYYDMDPNDPAQPRMKKYIPKYITTPIATHCFVLIRLGRMLETFLASSWSAYKTKHWLLFIKLLCCLPYTILLLSCIHVQIL
jgi:hypothetical protein